MGPNAVWASLAQAFMIMLGYTTACLAAATFAAFAVLQVDLGAVYTDWVVAFDTLTFIGANTVTALVTAFWASLACIALGEGLKLRGLVAYVVMGCAVGGFAALPFFEVWTGVPVEAVGENVLSLTVACGAIGGLVYWAIAGRTAGYWLELPWVEPNRR